jgi:signal transduction histidine kinase
MRIIEKLECQGPRACGESLHSTFSPRHGAKLSFAGARIAAEGLERCLQTMQLLQPQAYQGGTTMKHKLRILAAAAIGTVIAAVAASGADFATKDEAIAMVNKAVDYIKANGTEKAYAEIDKKGGMFSDRDLYIVVYGLDGHVYAHGANAALIGKDQSEAKDADGKAFVAERIALAKKGQPFWQDYKFLNPVTQKVEPKEMYCEPLNNTAVCGGVYRF